MPFRSDAVCWISNLNERSHAIFAAVCALSTLIITNAPAAVPTEYTKLSAGVLNQIAALEHEKASRTPAEQKVDSHLLFARKMKLGLAIANGVPTQRVVLDSDDAGRVLVDINAEVTAVLLQFLKSQQALVVSSFPHYHAIRAWISLNEIPMLASRNDVHFIAPAVRAIHHNVDSQGDYTHQANLARELFGVTGAGVNVGVISDSVDFLTDSQVKGLVTVLPGQDGSPATGEGTAMLEIVNDLAPRANLYFATADGGHANLANNILQLRAVGCDIIVDDVLYPDESPFQDALIAQAVNTVTADGALYFSAAGNAGNRDSGTSETWEGDFSDGGPAPQEAGRLHNFGGGTKYNTVLPGFVDSDSLLSLFWSDPLGHSANDYDVFVLDAKGAKVVASSTTRQNGRQDPYEFVDGVQADERIVIVKASGLPRFLHLDIIGGGTLSIGTEGQIRGHCCSAGAMAVAAVYAGLDYPNAFTGGSENPVEFFSSDGPRRIFFQPNGTPITPGNFSSTGGTVRQKPDIAAADGVTTSVPGFAPFFGTSAAAPHAAAIAALVKSANLKLRSGEIKAALTTNALDIMGPGIDRDSGAGIVMAPPAVAAVQSSTSAVPIVRITAPADGSTLSGQVTVEVVAGDTATNLVGVTWFRSVTGAGYSLIASNSVTGKAVTASFPWDTSTVTNGNYTIFAKAYDAAGNEGFSPIVNFSVLNGVTVGDFSSDPLWRAANNMIERWELILGAYLNQIAARNAALIEASSEQSLRFGHPVRPQLIEPDPHYLDYIDSQIDALRERQFQIQLSHSRP